MCCLNKTISVIIANKIDLRKIGWEVVDWIHLSYDRETEWTLVNTAERSGRVFNTPASYLIGNEFKSGPGDRQS
jgi:hypothetical protein